MEPFATLRGRAAPLMRANLDTDVIIRIERLTQLGRDELGKYAFEAIRYLESGRPNPAFTPGHPRFAGAPILIAADNFGCGSSREGAVWALQGMGFRCLITPGYGDIFRNNCFQNGVLPITLHADQVNELAVLAEQGREFHVDLNQCRIRVGDHQWLFEIDALRRQMLLEGLDEIALTLRGDEAALAWQDMDRKRRPWAWPDKVATR